MADYANEIIVTLPLEIQHDSALVSLTYFSLNPPSDPKDTTAPVVSFVTTPGAELSPTDPVVVDVTDNLNALGLVMLGLVQTGSDVVELVHDGTSFMPRYSALSTRVAIANGYRYSLRRAGGWAAGAALTFKVWAVDTDGNQA